MESDCKYHKSPAYRYEYVPSLSLERAYTLSCALKMKRPKKDFFLELADIFSDKNINQEYICLEMVCDEYSCERMKIIAKMENFKVQPFTGIKISENIRECNRLIRNEISDNDIYIYPSRDKIDEMTVFWLRLALYEDNNTGIIFSSFHDIKYDENTIYSPYENTAVSESKSFIISRKLIDRAGLFDESFESMQYAVFDYCMRILNLGYRNIIAKNSRFYGESGFCIKACDEKNFFRKWNIYAQRLCKRRQDIQLLIHRKQDERFNLLSIGCGAGNVPAGIKGIYPNSTVIGAEIPEYAFSCGDRVVPYITGSIYDISDYVHTLVLCGRERCFDYIILESVMEHIGNAVDYLKNISRNLSENGKIIVCIPNIMHHSVIAGLLRGEFTYKSGGILYEGCIHFYTYNEAKRHFYEAGLVIEECFYSLFENENSPGDKEIVNKILQIKDVACEVMFNAYEYFFLLKKR